MKHMVQYLRKKGFLSAFLLLISTGFIFGQEKSQQIQNLLSKYQEYGQFNGSVLIADNGIVIYKDGFGLANMEHEIPNKPDTKHRLGSITKQFTAALVLQLVEKGKLKLNAPISTYLAEYTGPASEVVTIHHLLTHSSGIPSYTSFPEFFKDQSRDPYSPKDFVKIFADSTLQFIPGEQFEYSNSGYFLLGHILEEVTGKTYEQVLQEQILNPLDMKDTGYDHHGNILKKRASGYEKSGNGYVNAPYLDMSLPYAAGSLYSTVDDLYKWDRALNTKKVLSEESRKLMFTPHIPAGDSQYGYGWMIDKMPVGKTGDSVNMVGHGGGINGFNTLIIRFPEEDDLIILLNNTGGTKLNAMAVGIKNILEGAEAEMPRRSLAMELLPVFANEGISAGLKKYKELKDNKSYDLNETDLNRVGYNLLQNGKVKEAIEVFKMNVEEFPDSWNTYDSLGEAYMVDGQIVKAITNYEKSVEMHPENSNGKEMLMQLRAQ